MLTDAANIIFQYAKRRCYVMSAAPNPAQTPAPPPDVIDLVEDDDYEWAIVDELEAEVQGLAGGSGSRSGAGKKRKPWLPDGMQPVLEELPKWSLLADVLQEIEEEMIRLAPHLSSRSSLSHFEWPKLNQ